MAIPMETQKLVLEGKASAAKYGTEICLHCGELRISWFCFTCWSKPIVAALEEKYADKD
ncbi:hypothetical protein LCGC14_2121580 [marine sediment metagenome]|uniref:Uncharacterized protein n=1 Tax=marine sediment metagenome TaxID=412755 RepID=A0A0F9GH93_9ZZZZ